MMTRSARIVQSAPDFSEKNILVVDDFREMRIILRDILCNCGADTKRIFMADNGNDAVALLKEVKFNIVLCDLVLKSGKNGQQILEQAKYESLIDPSCLWIMISAEKTMEAVSGAAEYKPDAYILKPITEDSLRTRMLKIWSKKAVFAEILYAMQQQDYLKAMQLCDKQLISSKAYTFDLLRIKCDLFLAMGDHESSRKLLEKILETREIPWAKVALAKIWFKRNDSVLAQNLLKETIEAVPTYIEAQDLLAQSLQKQGNFEEASTILERAIKLSPNSVVRQKMFGETAMKIGKLADAERAFRKSISLGENSVFKSADAYLALAKVCSANKNPAEALKALDLLHKNFATDEIRLRTLSIKGMVYHQNGDTEKARQIADELSQSMDADDCRLNSGDVLEVARLLLVAGDTDKAIKMLQSEIKSNPESAILVREVSEIFDQAGMGERGNKLIEDSRREAMLIMDRGVLLISKGQYEEAVHAMREANIAMPSNTRVLLNLAHVIITYIQKHGATPDLIEEARSSLVAANQLSPGEPRFIRLMASLNELASTAA